MKSATVEISSNWQRGERERRAESIVLRVNKLTNMISQFTAISCNFKRLFALSQRRFTNQE